MRRLQFTLKTLLWLMAVVAAFMTGIQFERERRRRADEAAEAVRIEGPNSNTGSFRR